MQEGTETGHNAWSSVLPSTVPSPLEIMTSHRAALPQGSVHLDVDVDVSDELEGGKEGDGAEHEEEDVAGEEGVAKELDRLQHARHTGALEVVEEGVEKHKDPRRPKHNKYII